MTFHDLEKYQLTIGHVTTHPDLEHAVREAANDDPTFREKVDGIDLLPHFAKHGIILPPGSTAQLFQSKHLANFKFVVRVTFGEHEYYASWDFPSHSSPFDVVDRELTMPSTEASNDDLKRYQLAMAHLIFHPKLRAAFEEAINQARSESAEEVDLLPIFRANGISLPDGSTASFRPPVELAEDDGTASICILIASHPYCVVWTRAHHRHRDITATVSV